MQINMRWDNVALIRRLEKGERRLGFAAVNSVNFGLKEIKKAEQEHVLRTLTIRRPDFTLREIAVIKPFASAGQARAFGEVSIGRKARSFLGLFVGGGVKEHRGKNVAIPVTGEEARPTFRTAQTFPPLVKRLKFKRPRRKRGGKPGAKMVLQGAEGRFLIPGEGIFRRRGSQVRAIIIYKPVVRIRPTLKWEEIARRVGERALREGMEREAINAIARTGGR